MRLRVGGGEQRLRHTDAHAADVVELELVHGLRGETLQVQPAVQRAHDPADHARGVLEQHALALPEGLLVIEPAHHGLHGLGARRRAGGFRDQVTAGDVDLVCEAQGDGLPGDGALGRFPGDVEPGDRGPAPGGLHRDLVTDCNGPGGDLPGVAAVVGELGRDRCGLRADDRLHGQREVLRLGELGGVREVLEPAQQGRARVPGGALRGLHHVVPAKCGDGNGLQVKHTELVRERVQVPVQRLEGTVGVVDQVDLVDRHDQVRHAQQRGDREVTPGLLHDPVHHVHEHDQRVRGGGTGDRVAGVLHVAGAVGQDEAAGGGGEVAVGHVDRDALLALGP